MNTIKKAPKRKINSLTVKRVPVKAEAEHKDGGFVVHQIKYEYVGQSKPYGVHKNSTPLRVGRFDTIKDAVLSERDNNLLKNIRAVYSNRPFVRGDYDAGTLSRLGERGYLKIVSGKNNSLNAMLQLTPAAA